MSNDGKAVPRPFSRRIVLVDDHPILIRGLEAMLNGQPGLAVVESVATVQEALEAAKRLKPDLMIVDIELKDGSGLDLVKSLRRTAPRIPVLLLSMHDEETYAERALRSGARGYVMKTEGAEKLLAAVRKVLAGEVSLSDRMVSRLLSRMVNAGSTAPFTPDDKLSDREVEVLRMTGLGMSAREIAERLGISRKTAEGYQQRIKNKLGLATHSDLVKQALAWRQKNSQD
jgi:DNA-binding NarL/FixJ family response regulator